ncbi:MAG: UbiX family flavin prenyltransferase [Arcobacteraceae bacterium]|jgi:4-hydroxy-3-polyprenylbenzoate decarboxylase|nr:UbiX family flavin prenyltransferase [Arcobacteraceae bacterium]
MKLIVGITGASGVGLGLKFLNLLPQNIEVFCVISNSAKTALKYEENNPLPNNKNILFYDDESIGACIASGSFQTDAMIILPCSMNTLAKCSVGISDTLITRAFSVMLKEKRTVVLAPREMPFNTIHLENMTKLSNLGVIISPPMLGYYSNQQTLDEMENFIIGKWFDTLKIEHNLYKRWS